MTVIEFPDQVLRTLSRADFRDLSVGVSVRVLADLPCSFALTGDGEILLSPVSASTTQSQAVVLRHAIELLMLRSLWPDRPALAGLSAARTAALFARLERPDARNLVTGGMDGMPDDAALTSDAPIGLQAAAALWSLLARHQPGAPDELPFDVGRLLARAWPLLGPTSWLMQGDGDRRLPVSRSGVNRDDDGHRPRRRAVTSASATVSVTSERGHRGAEAMRRAILANIPTDARAVGNAFATIRGVIRTAYGLPPGTFVALAPSEVECELFVLAAAQNHPTPRPLTMVLMADGGTGSLVPVAAAGRHVAEDTARGAAVGMSTLIDGFRDDTQVQSIALRTVDGVVRASDDIASECERVADAAVAAGRRVVLHRVDTSETGLLAPDIPTLNRLQERHPDQVDVVVDASQARLSPDRILEYLSLNWIVILTGSRFLAGPSSSGAVLVPETLRDRFGRAVPSGLRDYSGRAEWPPGLAAVQGLPPGSDVGLALRWAAALAELRAFNAMPAEEQRQVIDRFVSSVRSAILGNADLTLVDSPAPRRVVPRIAMASDDVGWNGMTWHGAGWDEIGTILGFALQDPTGPGWLSPDAVARVCIWLAADLGAHLPTVAAPPDLALARRRFQMGSPIGLSLAGREVGILRISISACLVSGEPPPVTLNQQQRLAQDVGNAEALLQKISLILRHWNLLDDETPRPPGG